MDDQQQLLFLQLCSEFLKLGYLYGRLLNETNNRRQLVRLVNNKERQKSKGLNYFRELMKTDNEEFFEWTRMSPDQFRNLYKLVRPRLLKRRRRPSKIHPELKLILTLSYLAQGNSEFFKKAGFKVGKSTVYQIVSEVCRNIWDILQPCYLAQPTQNVWRSIADEFSQKWQFPNCIGSVGGKQIRIQCPSDFSSQYRNSQKHFSLVLMATCDANYKFTMVDIGQFNSDDGVWAHSDMSRLFDNNLLDVPPKNELPDKQIGTEYALVGDETFPLKKYLLCPYPHLQLTDKERVFNYRLSRVKRVIENTFGILVSRWQILARPLRFSPENAVHCIKALICLHNFIITEEVEITPARRRYCSPQLVDRETADGILLEGTWRKQDNLLQNIDQLSNNNNNSNSNNSGATARAQRNVVRDYFATEIGEAQVPWQYQQALKDSNFNANSQ